MILRVYHDQRFTEGLEALRRQGGKSLAVAKKVDRLIKKMLIRRNNSFHEISKLTKHGELRIRHCKKYDLGNGYRLICFKEENQIVLLYVGTHDECSRWLERNKGLKYRIDDGNGDFLETKEIPAVYLPKGEEKDPFEEYEEQIIRKIDDTILRKIFCGLCE